MDTIDNTSADQPPRETPAAQPITTYAGFLRRAAAGLVDFAVLLPVIFLAGWVDHLSWLVNIVALFPLMALQLGYIVYCHGHWGQTIGKMAVGIQLRQLSGAAATWRQSWLRSSVDIALTLLFVGGIITSLAAIGPVEFNSLSIEKRQERLLQASPLPLTLLYAVQVIWVFSELLVLLFNKKRRAIHDFIAGTIVVEANDSRSHRLQKILLWPSVLAICAIVFLLVFLPIALPNFIASRRAETQHHIYNNLLIIDGAKQHWALENRKGPGIIPTLQDLSPYLKNGRFPEAVAGEIYDINPVGVAPTARLNDPAGTVITNRGFPGNFQRDAP